MGTIIGYVLASALFLVLISFGMALVISPIYSTINGWHERSDLENTFRVVAAALGLIVGLSIMTGALNAGIVFPVLR